MPDHGPIILYRTTLAVVLAVCVVLPNLCLCERALIGLAQAREFKLTHPCPSTGRTDGPCPGYVKDHIVPLACGGADAVNNMQWQTVRDAKAKDKWETKGCPR